MALIEKSFGVTSTAGAGSRLRFFAESTQPKAFAQGTGTLARGTIVARHTATGNYGVWISGDANLGTPAGFVWPEPVTLAAANEVIGVVMMKGTVQIDDIPLVGGAYTLANIQTVCRDGTLRRLGFTVQGVSNFT